MHRSLRLGTPALIAGLLASACAKEATGPTPALSTPLVPGVVCNAANAENQALETVLVIDALSPTFSPMPVDVLTDSPKVALPKVEVLAGGQPVELTRSVFISPTEIHAIVGSAEALAEGSYDVVVTNPNGLSGTAPGALRIVDPPVVSSIAVPTPSSNVVCNAIDSTITVTGTGFRPADGQLVQLLDASGTLVLSGAAADVQVLSETSVTLTLRGASADDLPPGTYGVRVVGTEGPPACRGTLAAALVVVPPPTITSVAPVTACTSVPTDFVITGTGFRADASVLFTVGGAAGVAPSTTTVESATSIHVSFPSGALTAGDAVVTVTNPELGDGGSRCSGQSASTITLFPPPTISQIAPAATCVGSSGSITVEGTGFHGAMTAAVGTTAATTVGAVDGTGTHFSFNVPAVAASATPYPVTVGIPEGCTATLAAALTVDPAPLLTTVDPAQGWNQIDTPVFLTGDGLVAGMSLALVGAAPSGGDLALADVAVLSPNTARASVPAGALPGTYALSMNTLAGCSTTLAAAFTVRDQPSLTISQVVPSSGWTGEKTPITIRGTNFQSTPKAYLAIPGATPRQQPLKSTAFIGATSLTSIVPDGLPVGGPYGLIVINPDGGAGKLDDAFRVVDLPNPSIDNVSPAAGATSSDTSVTITGCNFRSSTASPLTVSTVSSAGAVLAQAATLSSLSCNGPTTCPGGTGVCTLSATIRSATMATGAYLIRLTDTDDNTWSDFSAFVITNPSTKLEEGFHPANPLNTARRSLQTVSGRINSASRYLYALGGEAANGTALSTVEVAPMDLFGTLGTWFVQRYQFNAARSGLVAFQKGGYVYVLGGTSSTGGTGGATPSGTPLDTVERARILDFSDQPQLNEPTSTTTGALAKGTWYYQVAAVKAASDLDNPNGETLPSDEVVASLPLAGSAQLSWPAVPGATRYVVYRSEVENGRSGEEYWLAETDQTSYTDSGGAVDKLKPRPLSRGSTGAWVDLTTRDSIRLAHARFNAAATLAADPSGGLRAYLIGGHGSCSGGATNAAMGCYEMATLSADGKTLGAFAAGAGTLAVARERFGSGTMSAENGPSGYTAAQQFVFAAGGLGVSGSLASFEYASVDTNGVLNWKSTADFSPKNKDGAQLGVANGHCYAFGGGSPGAYTTSTKLAGPATISGATFGFSTWSDATQAILGGGLGRFGFTLESAYFYLVGGTSNDADALTQVQQVIY